eukprot:TRINITY_DN33257_c0_g1_i1.p1 TRINITY_DN33257_c0_g1~~TRINITY_DN33257_c0_g1_i1.p1  ORF type:complete len:330 (-),score=54.82 TRINITY_DN33257_c0_g1_i1:13-1002(-)
MEAKRERATSNMDSLPCRQYPRWWPKVLAGATCLFSSWIANCSELLPRGAGPAFANAPVIRISSEGRRVSSAKKVKHFINLSNGVEAIKDLIAAGVDPESLCFCRFQSTFCEKRNFLGLLDNVDHHMLLHLALGYECRVYDLGSRGNRWLVEETGKGERVYVPRAIWMGLEWIRYVLSRSWRLPEKTPMVKGRNVLAQFEQLWREVPMAMRTRFKYYRKVLTPELQELKLYGYYSKAKHDGQPEVHRDMLLDWVKAAASSRQERTLEIEAPEAFGYTLYDPYAGQQPGEDTEEDAPSTSSGGAKSSSQDVDERGLLSATEGFSGLPKQS